MRENAYDLTHKKVAKQVNVKYSAPAVRAALEGDGPVRVAGVDVSFFSDKLPSWADGKAVLTYGVMEYSKDAATRRWTSKLVYTDTAIVVLDVPYIAGYLAFREGPHIVQAYRRHEAKDPATLPHVILTDGNGLIHPKQAGKRCGRNNNFHEQI